MKKKKQRKLSVTRTISACTAAIIIFAAAPTVSAADYTPASLTSTVSVSDNDVAPIADDTVWYYRIHNGKKQMRCWSKTQAKWLTDWIDCV